MAVEISAIVTGITWILMRGSVAASGVGAGRPAPPWQFAGVDIFAVFMFGAAVVFLGWHRAGEVAADRSLRCLYLPPALLYFYLACLFARWRWGRRKDRGEPIRLHLKPDSPLSWAVYIWFAVWVFWQIIHGLAPWMLPSWLS